MPVEEIHIYAGNKRVDFCPLFLQEILTLAMHVVGVEHPSHQTLSLGNVIRCFGIVSSSKKGIYTDKCRGGWIVCIHGWMDRQIDRYHRSSKI